MRLDFGGEVIEFAFASEHGLDLRFLRS
jgi:hypothetical protein